MTKLLEIITAIILLLGYVAYGLSIYCYTYAQRTIGAAKTSTYYALAPFIGALLSILMLGEPVTPVFIIASIIMAAGCWIAAKKEARIKKRTGWRDVGSRATGSLFYFFQTGLLSVSFSAPQAR